MDGHRKTICNVTYCHSALCVTTHVTPKYYSSLSPCFLPPSFHGPQKLTGEGCRGTDGHRKTICNLTYCHSALCATTPVFPKDYSSPSPCFLPPSFPGPQKLPGGRMQGDGRTQEDYLHLTDCHTVTFSHSHSVTLSHSTSVTLSHCHTVILSHCHTVTLSHCHTLTLSQSHTLTLSLCHTLTLSQCHYLTHCIVFLN